jgi:hypothetical protein
MEIFFITISLLIIAALSWVFYFLILKGNIWPIFFGIITIWGGKELMLDWFPSSKGTFLTFFTDSRVDWFGKYYSLEQQVSWAIFVPTLILVMTVFYLVKNRD